MPSLSCAVAEVAVAISTEWLAEEGIDIYEDGGSGHDINTTPEYKESFSSSGGEDGSIGAWVFCGASNVRDGTELISADEVRSAREARAQRQREEAATKALLDAKKHEVEMARQARRAQAELDGGGSNSAASPSEGQEKYNPYLAHMEDDEDDTIQLKRRKV